jgi:hypothetical protein
VGELRLRRFRLGELASADREEISRHTTDCSPCRARLRSLDEEQRQFERDIPFERFAGGVERARRVPRVHPRRVWSVAAVALAAAAALVLVLRPGGEQAERLDRVAGTNRIKGASLGTIQIAARDGRQRVAASGRAEALASGERVRLGFRSPQAAHLVAVSIDDAGIVTPLYPERGPGLAVEARAQVTYLPDSLEFTGQGRERVFLLLSERPLGVDEVVQAARAAHARAQGDLRAVTAVAVSDEAKVAQFTWLFHKP